MKQIVYAARVETPTEKMSAERKTLVLGNYDQNRALPWDKGKKKPRKEH